MAVVLRCSPVALLVALAILATPAVLASAQVADDGSRRCPGTFHVLDPERIGALRIEAGMHDLAVFGDVSCADAPRLLAGFLQDWDGRLPRRWEVSATDSEVLRAGSGDGIRLGRAQPARAPGRTTTVCPYFTIPLDARVGDLTLKAGRYTMRLLSRRMDCAQAARELHGFLYDAKAAPFPWRAEPRALNDVTFRRGSDAYGFRTRRAYADTAGGGSYPAPGNMRCPNTFLVQHPGRIGKLTLTRGMHHLTVHGGVTCEQAVDAFKVFLGMPSGALPAPWRLRSASASFLRGKGAARGFWLDRAEPVRGHHAQSISADASRALSAASGASGSRLERAVRAARTAERRISGGRAYDIEADRHRGKRVWETKVAMGTTRAYEVDVSADGRKVVRVRRRWRTDDDVRKAARATVSLPRALRTAGRRAEGGTFDEAEIDRSRGRIVWEVTFRKSGDRELEVTIDARTGKVRGVTHDD